jgi:Zn-dependent peptidase ImmA (M78 family)
VTLRRGFKAEANEIALEVRRELGVIPIDRLDAWALARHLDIPVHPLSALHQWAAAALHHFSEVHPAVFSAVTVFDGPRRAIYHNDAHNPGRQASNLAHELAHGLLLHPPTPALDDRGCREWDQNIEDEATWLGGVLLITEQAALSIARRGLSMGEAAAIYGVSEQMVRYRLNMTAAQRRVRVLRR